VSPDLQHADEKLIKLKDSKAMLYLLRFAVKDKLYFSISFFLLMASSLAGVFSARALGALAEKGLAEGALKTSVYLGVTIIVCEVASILLTYLGRRELTAASLRSVLRVREALFDHLEALPMKFFDQQPQGRIVTRLTHDVDTMEGFFSQTLARLANAIITLVVVLTAMLILDWQIGLLICLAMIPAWILTFAVRGPVRRWNREFAIRNSTINARLGEYLNGIPVIRSFGLEKWSKNSFDQTVDNHLEAAISINKLNAWSRPLIMFFTSIPLALFIGIGGWNVIEGALSIGIFISFIRLCERFLHPMNVISQEIHVVQTALTNTERVASFLKHPTEDSELGSQDEIFSTQIKGEILFNNVTMGYDPQNPVLRGVTFQVKAGEKIGLAGRTGSGKTSTLALLSRLYEYQDGNIQIDGIDIRKIHRETLRNFIGVVNQDAIVFEATLKENLLAGTDKTEAEVIQACETTGLTKIMEANKLNLDSLIYDQGANLSAGERQLLSLTRILLKNPSILVLDEATANIDPFYESIIHDAVEKVMKNRTCFIIAHRLETLKTCDRIFVFKDGQLAEEGPLESLLNNPHSHYTQLYNSSQHV
jgi:ATP-binding cassette, subfamily B, multidrug efflux pump